MISDFVRKDRTLIELIVIINTDLIRCLISLLSPLLQKKCHNLFIFQGVKSCQN